MLAGRIAGRSLVQVVAPAGSGKTTAVVQAAGTVDRSLAWLTLDRWHRSPGRLLDELVAALQPVVPRLARALEGDAESAPPQLAAAVGAFVRRQHALLVLDDCHMLDDSPEAVAVLASLVRRAVPGLHVVLIGRTALPLPGLDLETLAPDVTIGDEFLRATAEEAEEILRAKGAAVEVEEAMEATNGWVAGLVFETWRARGDGPGNDDPLRDYLGREVFPRLGGQAVEALVAASVFGRVDASRAQALGVDDPRSWLSSLRGAGLPAVWATGGASMRLHPRIRELLRAQLDTGPAERRHLALQAAAGAYEREGNLERALDLSLQAGDTPTAERLLPEVIGEIVERQDIGLAEHYLASVSRDPESAQVVLARQILASFKVSGSEADRVLSSLLGDDRLASVLAEEPRCGPFACNHLAVDGQLDQAIRVLDALPPGRSADVARFILSLARDDPASPIPPFQDDVLDSIIARALYMRGRLAELQEGSTAWAVSSGTPVLLSASRERSVSLPAGFLQSRVEFSDAILARDLATAQSAIRQLVPDGRGPEQMRLLWEAELAVRLEHDPTHARTALSTLQTSGFTAPYYRELAASWEGAAALLADEPQRAAMVLREAVASMRRGDRSLALARALVYLAEAEWRLGNEEVSDRATDDAYEVARRQGSLRELMLSLADFPGVLSRRLDADPAVDGPWHSLGRALIADSRSAGALVVPPVAVHVREFGEPALLVDGREVRPKIRKSIELLSYLLVSTGREVSRGEVLTALWNGRDDDSTRAYLRQALRHLREVLPAGVAVEARGDVLVLEGALTCESLELDALLTEAARDPGAGRLGYLLEALELVGRGLFLHGSSDVTWIDDRRTQIASIRSDARLDAAELLLGADRHLRALALVNDALDADPLSERAWRIHMRTLGLLGDYDGVTAALAACTNALAEIGLEPSAATRELAHTLRR
jgi:DNA-binding SARP family transcriptional activator